MEVSAKMYAPTLGAFFMTCDLSKPENQVMLAESDWCPKFVETEFTAKDCQQTLEGFKMVCLAAMANRLGVQVGTWEGRFNIPEEAE
jgi:hypothetical protein